MMKTGSAINDFVLLMFFIGNDFLPHHPSLNDVKTNIDFLISLYQKLQLSFTNDDNSINDTNFFNFIKLLSNHEPELMKNESKRSFTYSSAVIDNATTVTRTISTREENITYMCHDYIKGIFWVYSYYSKGMNNINNHWYYHYYHAPLFVDLSPCLEIIQQEKNKIIGWEFNSLLRVLNPIHQLLSVLPASSS